MALVDAVFRRYEALELHVAQQVQKDEDHGIWQLAGGATVGVALGRSCKEHEDPGVAASVYIQSTQIWGIKSVYSKL